MLPSSQECSEPLTDPNDDTATSSAALGTAYTTMAVRLLMMHSVANVRGGEIGRGGGADGAGWDAVCTVYVCVSRCACLREYVFER